AVAVDGLVVRRAQPLEGRVGDEEQAAGPQDPVTLPERAALRPDVAVIEEVEAQAGRECPRAKGQGFRGTPGELGEAPLPGQPERGRVHIDPDPVALAGEGRERATRPAADIEPRAAQDSVPPEQREDERALRAEPPVRVLEIEVLDEHLRVHRLVRTSAEDAPEDVEGLARGAEPAKPRGRKARSWRVKPGQR